MNVNRKSAGWARVARAGAVLFLGLSSVGSYAELPHGEYACQVLTQQDRKGLVLVQTNSREQAKQVALGAEAITRDEVWDQTSTVVECIVQGQEKFRDLQFQYFYENVPL